MIIREYERIFADECPHFDELSKFTEAGEFLSFGWQRGRGAYVQAKNYVGVIRLPSGFQTEILPKLNAPSENLRGLVVDMLRTLEEFNYKKFVDANLDTARLDLYEIFIRVYLGMVTDLVKRGLKSSYVVREDNLNVFKGKLLVNENLCRNVAHRERFFVTFDEYSPTAPNTDLLRRHFGNSDTPNTSQRSNRQDESQLQSCHELDAQNLGGQKLYAVRGQDGGDSVALRHEQVVRGLRCR